MIAQKNTFMHFIDKMVNSVGILSQILKFHKKLKWDGARVESRNFIFKFCLTLEKKVK